MMLHKGPLWLLLVLSMPVGLLLSLLHSVLASMCLVNGEIDREELKIAQEHRK